MYSYDASVAAMAQPNYALRPYNLGMWNVPSPIFQNLDWSIINTPIILGSSSASYVWDDIQELFQGLRFRDKVELQNAVKQYSIKRHQQYQVERSNTTIWVVKCKRYGLGCEWRLRAKKHITHDQFEITKYGGAHTCVAPMLSQDRKQLDAKMIAHEIRDVVKESPGITIKGIIAMIKNNYNYVVSYQKAWEGKQKAIASIFGGWKESYELLPTWMSAVEEFNPGSWVKYITKPGCSPNTALLDYVFWTFAPAIEGFKSCRPVISIDATHLYGKYTGKLLIAMGMDPNNQIFPLAFAIVDEESYDT